MRGTPLLLLLTACADPLRLVYATSAEGELSLFQIALIEGYQIGTGEIRIDASNGEIWTCPVRLRGSETGLLGEVGMTELSLDLSWRDELRADRLFARYWGVEAAGGVVNVHHELRARSMAGVNLRGSSHDGAAVQAMANLTSLVLGQPGDCAVTDAIFDTAEADQPEPDDVNGVNFDDAEALDSGAGYDSASWSER